MSHIEINYDTVESAITEVIAMITNNQSDLETAYSNLAGCFSESAGEEADALRSLQEAERSLTAEMNTVLTKFGESIRFAVNEFNNMDSTGAASMSNAGAVG